jgi:hypothetical protein
MKVSELLASDAVKEALGEDGLNAINALVSDSQSVAEKLKEAEGKIGGITEQKKKAQKQLSELSERMEALETAGLSKGEQAEREKTKTAELLAKAETELTEMKAQVVAKERSMKLGNIATDLHFLSEVDAGTQNLLLENAFKDVDLNSPETVSAVLTQFKEKNKPFLQANTAASGTGTKSTGAGSVPTSNELTVDSIRNMSTADFAKNRERLWKEASKEAIAS